MMEEITVVSIECNKHNAFYDEPDINLFETSDDAFMFAKQKIEVLKKNGFEEHPLSQEEDDWWCLNNDKTNVQINIRVLVMPVHEKYYSKYYSMKDGHKLV